VTEHSPLPWSAGIDNTIWGSDGFRVARMHPPDVGIVDLPTREKEDAEFICRAVNSHDDLLAALRAILFQVRQGKVLERDACIAQARAAIAKAEGTS
jgi:hypothetical protein